MAHTLSDLLLRLKEVLENPRYPPKGKPTKWDIERLHEHVRLFTFDFEISNGKQKKTVRHSFNEPYPPLNPKVTVFVPEFLEPQKEKHEEVKEHSRSATQNDTNSEQNTRRGGYLIKTYQVKATPSPKPSEEVSPTVTQPPQENQTPQPVDVKPEEPKPEKPKKSVKWGTPDQPANSEEGQSKYPVKTEVFILEDPKPRQEENRRYGRYTQVKVYEKKVSAPKAQTSEPEAVDPNDPTNFWQNVEESTETVKPPTQENAQQKEAPKETIQPVIVEKASSQASKIIEIQTTKEEPREKSPVNSWERPVKKPQKAGATSKPSTSTVVVKSEASTHLKHEKELQEKIEYLLNSEDFKNFMKREVPSAPSLFTQENVYNVSQGEKTRAEIEDDVARRLVCSSTRKNYFNYSQPTFGYPILIETNKKGQKYLSLIPEFLCDAGLTKGLIADLESPQEDFVVDKVRTTRSGLRYNYWLPLYIEENHYKFTKPLVKNAVCRLANYLSETSLSFEPAMVLDTLIPILANLGSQLNRDYAKVRNSIYLITAYSQVYLLLKKLIEEEPKIKEAIEQDIRGFIENRRQKRVREDLGQLQIKLLFSTESSNYPELNKIIFREHLDRVLPNLIALDGSLAMKEKCPDFISRFMTAFKTLSEELLIQRETAAFVKDSNVLLDLEGQYGCVDRAKIEVLISRIEWIKTKLPADWNSLAEGLGVLKYFENPKDMLKCILTAYESADI